MAGSKSNYLENELLDHVLGNAAYTAPANTWLGVFTSAPTDAGGGTEVSAGDYARLQVVNNSGNWPAASGGAKASGAIFSYAEATNNWGTVNAFGIFDAQSAGNLLYWADLTEAKAVNSGDTLRFPSGDIDVTED